MKYNPLKHITLTSAQLILLIEAVEGGKERIKDTLENPLESVHYSDADLAKLERKVTAIDRLLGILESA